MASDSDSAGLQPATQALEACIQATVQQLLNAGDGDDIHGLLFLGSWHDAMPRLIFQDPVLQPVDTRIWGVIKIAASSGPTAFPTYKQIAALANVGSDATVARSMAILRATRWLTLCRRVRDTQGRFRGNIYALHDEPLPLADALYLDREYMQFLDQAHTHGHPQVCKVAAAVLATIAEDLAAGRDVGGHENPMQRRLEAINAVAGDGHRFFAFSSRQLQKLKAVPETASPQNLKCAPLQKLKSDCSSSSYIYKKTTTTTEDTTQPPARAREEAVAPLVFPPSLAPNERHLSELCLRNAPVASHQDILDELGGRLLEAKRKQRPIDNPIGYLARLCKAACTGEFTLTSLGLKAREQRSCEKAAATQPSVVSRDRALMTDMRAALKRAGNTLVQRADREQQPADGSAITTFDRLPDGTAIKPALSTDHPLESLLDTERDGTAISHTPNAEAFTRTMTPSPGDGIVIKTADPPESFSRRTLGPPADGTAIKTSPVPQTPLGSDAAPVSDGSAIKPVHVAAMHPSDVSRNRALTDMRAALGRAGNTLVQRADREQRHTDGSAITTFDRLPDGTAIKTSPLPQASLGSDVTANFDGSAIKPAFAAEHPLESAPNPRRDGAAIRHTQDVETFTRPMTPSPGDGIVIKAADPPESSSRRTLGSPADGTAIKTSLLPKTPLGSDAAAGGDGTAISHTPNAETFTRRMMRSPGDGSAIRAGTGPP